MWIHFVPYEQSEGYLRSLYDRVKGPNGAIDNVMKAHSLRPHTMEGHSALYKSVLHHTGNVLPVWFLECLGIYTSLANACDYSVAHHFSGLSRLLQDQSRADAIFRALKAGSPEEAFADKELALLRYVRTLTASPQTMRREDVETLRAAGVTGSRAPSSCGRARPLMPAQVCSMRSPAPLRMADSAWPTMTTKPSSIRSCSSWLTASSIEPIRQSLAPFDFPVARGSKLPAESVSKP